VTPASDRPTVVIADDHAPTRAGVRAALEAAGFDVRAEAGSAGEAVRAVAAAQPDVALLDVRMPGGGIGAAEAIADRVPETRVVMLTVSRDDGDLFAALKAGAVGYLLKDTDPDRLPMALRGVLNGEAALPRALVARVIEEFRDRGQRRRLPALRRLGVELTEREWDVLELLREELPTKEIAARLQINEVTVRRHAGAILRKLRVKDRRAAVRLLAESGGGGSSRDRA
jgi:DNA-binding NarL/FixJ family response regulator